MGAIVWAGIGRVVYGASIADASKFGRQIQMTCQDIAQKSWYDIKILSGIDRERCLKLFDMV